MTSPLSPGALAALCVLVSGAAPAAAQTAPAPRYELRPDGWWRIEATGTFRVDPDVISARFLPGVDGLAGARAALAPVGGPAAELALALETLRVNRLGVHDLRLPAGADALEAVAALRQSGLFEFVEENTFGEWVGASNDPALGNQWHFVNNGQSGGTVDADVDADIAWSLTTGSEQIVIGVLDSGTAINHPDLSFGTWINVDEVPNNGQDDDNNGFVDDRYGWDFPNNSTNVEGPYFHGTAVTGLITGHTDNGLGIAGLAGGFGPQQGCLSMAVQVGDFGPSGAILDDAILYAADNGARVITMSLTVGHSNAIDMALSEVWNNQDVFVDCAAGNSNGGPVGYPANHPDCVACPSSDRNDERSGFSSVGPENWVAAPGEDVYTCDLGNGYLYTSGTSFSAPHIAAGAALVFSVLPNTSNESVKEILRLTADDIEAAGYDQGTGWGRLNAGSAVLEAVASDCNGNGVWDPEDIAQGTSSDTNGDGVPDECACTPATSYCLTGPNSNGAGATIGNTGSQSAAANDLVLGVSGASSSMPGIFYYGSASVQQPYGDGFRCVGGTVFRLPVVITDAFGDASWALDLTSPPQPAGQISPGDTWYFQFWYRDPAFGGAGFNLSDGREVPFCP